MATQWISPTWRMPENSNQSKVDNYSLSFNGTDEKIEFDAITLATSYTISVWAKRDNTAAQEFLLGNDANFGYGAYFNGTSNIYFKQNAGNTDFSNAAITTALARTDWVHWMFIKDSTAGTLAIYVDGALAQSITSAKGMTNLLAIGGDGIAATNYIWDGEIGQVAVYGEALDSDARTALYNSGTPVNPMALTPLPTAYYPLGGGSTGDAADPATTLTVPNESVPSATVFNFIESSTQYIDIGTNNSVLMPTDEMSISSWVKFSAAAMGNFAGVFSANSAGGNDGYILLKWNTNLLQFYIREGGAWRTASFSPAVVQDVWYHVVGTWDGTDVKIYVDNVVGGTTATASSITYNASTVNRIGDYATYEMDGDIANVQFWNKGLSAANVTTLYNNGVPYTGTQPEATNLKAWYKLNVDTSTWDGTDWVIGEAQANYSSALDFDGSSNVTTSGNTGTDNATFAAWIRTTETYVYTANQCAFGSRNAASGDNYTLGRLSSQFSSPNDTVVRVFNTFGSTKLNDGNWHHIAYTYDYTSKEVKAYVDGNSTPEVTFSIAGYSTSFGIHIGYNGSAYNFKGDVSNCLYYNKILTGAEVTTLYNNGTPEISPSHSPTGWWKCDNLTTGIQDSVGSNNGTNNGATVEDIQVSTLNGISSGMTTANLVTSDLTRSIPYSSYSMTFDGAADYIDCGDSSVFSFGNGTDDSPFSVSAWVYVGDTGVNRIISKVGSGGGEWIFTTGTGSRVPLLTLYSSGATTAGPYQIGVGSTTLNSYLDTWVHLAATYDGGGGATAANGIKVYFNGVLETMSTLTAGTYVAMADTAASLKIGSETGWNVNYYNGNISNAAIFNSELSQDQILTIYNGGVPNSISSLSPVAWWSLAGDSYFDGSNWICPDLSSNSNNGTSASMGGTVLVGNGPGSTANGVATSMDIPANLKGNAPNSTNNAFSINMTAIDRVTSVPG